jgi:GH24 family phage-related lysozyme (muramidase)
MTKKKDPITMKALDALTPRELVGKTVGFHPKKGLGTLHPNIKTKYPIVETVQTALTLNGLGRIVGKADGYFGGRTLVAIRIFQQHGAHVAVDGLIGNITWKQLLSGSADDLQGFNNMPQADLDKLITAANAEIKTRISGSETGGGSPKILQAMTVSEKGYKFIYRIEAGPKSNSLHHPTSTSGVTIGAGYDMKERKAANIKADLEKVNVPNNVAAVLSLGAGLIGQAADSFCAKNKALVNLTVEQQLGLLKLIIPREYERLPKTYVKVAQKQNEYDALVCFAYNPGGKYPPVASLINAGKITEAMALIKSRNKAGGQVIKGLTNRRNYEVNLYLNGAYDVA